jgi:hypothetical protein
MPGSSTSGNEVLEHNWYSIQAWREPSTTCSDNGIGRRVAHQSCVRWRRKTVRQRRRSSLIVQTRFHVKYNTNNRNSNRRTKLRRRVEADTCHTFPVIEGVSYDC